MAVSAEGVVETRMALTLSVVIPSYQRNQVLLATLEMLLRLRPKPLEILVVDQTVTHFPEVEKRLVDLEQVQAIRRIRLPYPSITHAMNVGLNAALGDVVLYLDDDIAPEDELFNAHIEAHEDIDLWIAAGRVIQPWQEGIDFHDDLSNHFACLHSYEPDGFMGGNFSVKRDLARKVGGFDENFVRVAYRFEAEFAHRVRDAGGRIRFVPDAMLHHLKAIEGGTRSYGNHLTTWRPDHSVGEYYFLLVTRSVTRATLGMLRRVAFSIATRHHLRQPWWILPTLVGEVWGMIWATRLFCSGPALIGSRYHESVGDLP